MSLSRPYFIFLLIPFFPYSDLYVFSSCIPFLLVLFSPVPSFAVIRASVLSFQARSQNFEKRLLASSCPSVGPSSIRSSVRMEQLGSHWTYFNVI